MSETDLVKKLRGFLSYIAHDGDLHLAPGTPAQLYATYQQLEGMGLIAQTPLNSARGFWKLTDNGRQALETGGPDGT